MAFGIGTNTEHPEHQLLAGAVNEVAVKCWFTSTGRSIPLVMKLQTESDGIIEVSPIQVFSSEKQFYAGILNWKYKCQAEVNHRMQEFTLLFCPEDCAWKLVV